MHLPAYRCDFRFHTYTRQMPMRKGRILAQLGHFCLLLCTYSHMVAAEGAWPSVEVPGGIAGTPPPDPVLPTGFNDRETPQIQHDNNVQQQGNVFSADEFAHAHRFAASDALRHVKYRSASSDCPLPAGRWLHTATHIAGSIFIFGGVDSVTAKAVQHRNEGGGEETSRRSMGAAGKSVNPTDYLLNDLWSYSLSTNFWREIQHDTLPCPDRIPSGDELEELRAQVPQYKPANLPAPPPMRAVPHRLPPHNTAQSSEKTTANTHKASTVRRFTYASHEQPEQWNRLPAVRAPEPPGDLFVSPPSGESASFLRGKTAQNTQQQGLTPRPAPAQTAKTGAKSKVFLQLEACERYGSVFGAVPAGCMGEDSILLQTQHQTTANNMQHADRNAQVHLGDSVKNWGGVEGVLDGEAVLLQQQRSGLRHNRHSTTTHHNTHNSHHNEHDNLAGYNIQVPSGMTARVEADNHRKTDEFGRERSLYSGRAAFPQIPHDITSSEAIEHNNAAASSSSSPHYEGAGRSLLYAPSDALWQFDLSSQKWLQPASRPRPSLKVLIKNIQSGELPAALLSAPPVAEGGPADEGSQRPELAAARGFAPAKEALNTDLQYPSLIPVPRPLYAPMPRFLHAAVAMARGLVIVAGVTTHDMRVMDDVWHFDPEPPQKPPKEKQRVNSSTAAAGADALLPFKSPQKGWIWRRVWPLEAPSASSQPPMQPEDPLGPSVPSSGSAALPPLEGHSAVVVRYLSTPIPSRRGLSPAAAVAHTDVTNAPVAGASASGGEVLLVYGGMSPTAYASQQLKDVGLVRAFSLNPTQAWHNHSSNGSTPTPADRWLHAAATITLPMVAQGRQSLQDYMIVFGGCSFDLKPLSDVWLYHYPTNAWRELVAHGYGPSPRWLTILQPIQAPILPMRSPTGPSYEVPPGSLYDSLERAVHPENILSPGGLRDDEIRSLNGMVQNLVAEQQDIQKAIDAASSKDNSKGVPNAPRFSDHSWLAGGVSSLASGSVSTLAGGATGAIGNLQSGAMGSVSSVQAGGLSKLGSLKSSISSMASSMVSKLKTTLSSGLSGLTSAFGSLGAALKLSLSGKLRRPSVSMPVDADKYDDQYTPMIVPLPPPPSAAWQAQVDAIEEAYSSIADAEDPGLDLGDWSGGESVEFRKNRASLGLDAESFDELQKESLEKHSAHLIKQGILTNDTFVAPAGSKTPFSTAANFLELGTDKKAATADGSFYDIKPPSYITFPDISYGSLPSNLATKPALYVFGGSTANGVVFQDHFILHLMPDTGAVRMASGPFPNLVAFWEQLLDMNSGPIGRVGSAAVAVTSVPAQSGILGYAARVLGSQPLQQGTRTGTPTAPSQVKKTPLKPRFAQAEPVYEDVDGDVQVATVQQALPATSNDTATSNEESQRTTAETDSHVYTEAVYPAPGSQWILLFGGAERMHPVHISQEQAEVHPPLGSMLMQAMAASDEEELHAMSGQ